MRNTLADYGYTPKEIEEKIAATWHHTFENPETKFYHDQGDMACMEDTGNVDARSEGMSYGMMMAVQMNRKDIFDKLWLWTMTHMYQTDGEFKGYFAWSCKLDGTKNSQGPAPDGEEYFAYALFCATQLWGDGEAPFNYSQQAKDILHAMIHKGKEPGTGAPMFNNDNKLILFVPGSPFSDPSYHLPHFYEKMADLAYPEDKAFLQEAAVASRKYLPTACHPVTGLAPDYGNFDGTPAAPEWRPLAQAHYSDSYRVAMNIAIDTLWKGAPSPWDTETAEKIQRFYLARPDAMTETAVYIDGTPYPEPIMHPLGLLATAAAISIAREVNEESHKLITAFWDAPLRNDKRRYYDNFLYIFCLLALAGEYKPVI